MSLSDPTPPPRTAQVRVLFVGGGPAGLAPLVWAARHGTLAQVAAQGLAIVERGPETGAGTLGDHGIGSDTLAETFLECLADGAEPRLSALRDHETAVRLATYKGGAAPLSVAAAFLTVLGHTMHDILVSRGAVVLTRHDAQYSRQLSDGKWSTRAIGPAGQLVDIVSEFLVLATGAEQRLEDVQGARLGARALLPALADKMVLSGEVLARGGAELIEKRLANKPSPKVAIVGGSHSALASANRLLGGSTHVALGEGSVTVLHRRPLRIFYPSTQAALDEGYTDFTAADVCPLTQRLFRLSGFRLAARELVKQALQIGGAAPEPRLRLQRLQDDGAETEAWRTLEEADLVIGALGYRPRGLRLIDSSDKPIALLAHAAHGAPLVDGECRVLDQNRNPIPGVMALGLAAGFVPSGPLGGEPSFRGQTNGLWLWQNDIGAMIIRRIGRERRAKSYRRTSRLKVALIVGTRPEAIKLAPVALAMRSVPGLTTLLWCTGQHLEWAPQSLGFFGLTPDRVIDTTDTANGLTRLGGTLLLGLQAAIHEDKPDIVIVQGDTSSAFAGALAAAYAGLPVVHVEAGLRSTDSRSPFPEEPHRRTIAHFTDLHCSPTEIAVNHLRSEGVDERNILLCGNTVIDALFFMRQNLAGDPVPAEKTAPPRRLLLLTCHRRESWGAPFAGICSAIRRIAERGDCEIVFVLHPNPALAEMARSVLGAVPNVRLVPPQGYPQFVELLVKASLILTDSGGVQEEATALGTPLMILRENTERPEALQTGNAQIVGTREEDIVSAVGAVLDADPALSGGRVPSAVYGDGLAGQRIARAIADRWLPVERRGSASQFSEPVAALAVAKRVVA
jgi:UDP-N-acetylglucosamine 2-epimerase (non-hydrolysing)